MWYVGRMVGFGSLVAVLLAVGPGGVFAQKKKKDADTPQNSTAAEADYAAVKATMFPAKIVTFEAGKSVTVRVETTQKEKNPNYKPPVTTPGQPGYNANAAKLQTNMTNLQNQLKNGVTAKNQARIMQEIATINTQLAKLNSDPNNQPMINVTTSKDYDFDLQKKVVYRKMFLPMETDSEGNPKKFTAEEKLTLRGPTESPPLPGYVAKSDEVEAGQEVKLYFTLPKKKAKDDDTAQEHPTVKMLVLTKRAGAAADTDTPKKK